MIAVIYIASYVVNSSHRAQEGAVGRDSGEAHSSSSSSSSSSDINGVLTETSVAVTATAVAFILSSSRCIVAWIVRAYTPL
jgi:hypothetical protein